jgi:hypothetical protein
MYLMLYVSIDGVVEAIESMIAFDTLTPRYLSI